MNNNQFGIYLQTLRKQNNYTQAFVAERIGVIRQTYSHYETGRVCPSVSVLCCLADLYEIPLQTLLDTTNGASQKQTPKTEVMFQLSQAEQQIIQYHRLLDEREQEYVMDFMTTLAKKKKNKQANKNLGV